VDKQAVSVRYVHDGDFLIRFYHVLLFVKCSPVKIESALRIHPFHSNMNLNITTLMSSILLEIV